MSSSRLCVTVLCACACAAYPTRPNIVFIIADDLGFNDVGFHGSNQIPTPNIDALAYSGLVLHNYYVTPICTPSRAALMTGKYPIHTGMQHTVLMGAEPRGLPLSEKLLPQYLKELGYRTHLVGKWHLGSYKKEYLPLNRGFDSHLGFWTGKIDMYDHTNMERGSWGHDFRQNFKLADDLFGKYATDIYTNEAVRVIKSHNKSEPLFLVVAHSAMHSGNPYEPLRAPDDAVNKFSGIGDVQRRKYAGMLSKLDESVGKVVSSLQKHGLLENSIIVFTTDNGGPAAGFNENAASNYPLKGVKNTLWEGGVRAAGLLWSPLLTKRSRVANQTLHIVDWLPTLYSAIGANCSVFKDIDGIDQWEALSKDQSSKRSTLVHNIDDIWGSAAVTVGKWKIVKGTNYGGQWDEWYGPSGREGSYNVDLILRSEAAAAINRIDKMPDTQHITHMRESATVRCSDKLPAIPCQPLKEACLFNVQSDPCERRNLARLEPQMYSALMDELQRVNRTAVPPSNLPLDPRGDPRHWGRVYTNFGDYEQSPYSGNCA